MKKMLAFGLCLAMLAALCVPALADDVAYVTPTLYQETVDGFAPVGNHEEQIGVLSTEDGYYYSAEDLAAVTGKLGSEFKFEMGQAIKTIRNGKPVQARVFTFTCEDRRVETTTYTACWHAENDDGWYSMVSETRLVIMRAKKWYLSADLCRFLLDGSWIMDGETITGLVSPQEQLRITDRLGDDQHDAVVKALWLLFNKDRETYDSVKRNTINPRDLSEDLAGQTRNGKVYIDYNAFDYTSISLAALLAHEDCHVRGHGETAAVVKEISTMLNLGASLDEVEARIEHLEGISTYKAGAQRARKLFLDTP